METIDFNDVIRDPETISVVGKLLPEVNGSNKGFIKYQTIINAAGNKKYKLSALSPAAIYSSFSIEMYIIRDAANGVFILSPFFYTSAGHKPANDSFTCICGTLSALKVYYKINESNPNKDGNREYIIQIPNNSNGYFVLNSKLSINTSDYSFAETDDDITDWTELPVVSIKA